MPAISDAQVVVPPGTEVPIPLKPKTDSAAAKVKTDTIKAAFGRGVGPRTADVGPQFSWNRTELFASGALTVADLIERVPWATSFRSGWLASPKFVAVNGDLGRVKVFYDGIELDNIDPRSGSMLDLNSVQLYTLENVSIERFANELRVHLRSWRADRTDPFTRVDILTGDENTNVYRGYYGKRFDSGAGLQVAGQQHSTRSVRLGGGGDALSFMIRTGIAKKNWSIDAFELRTNASRVLQPTFGSGLSLPPFQGVYDLGYVRAGLGKVDGGPWLQLIASTMQLAESSPTNDASSALTRHIIADTTDTTTKRRQFVVSGGYFRGPLKFSATDRIRAFDKGIYHTPSVRLEFGNTLGLVELFGERSFQAKTTRGDAIAQLTPVPFFSVTGSVSTAVPDSTPVGGSPQFLAARVEAGVRLLGPWLIAGFITRDTAILKAPTVFDTAYMARPIGRRNGIYAGLRGRLYRDINMDVQGTMWDSGGFYQPRYQARSEIDLATNWLSRFPSGNFGLKIGVSHDYRSTVSFPVAGGVRKTNSSGIFSALVEIRILRGVVTYQVRNIVGDQYQIVPDFFMPRAISLYGLRWEFWN
ncbi:MAG: hypothetical protein ABIQ55_01105 [Gemmatimonadaceae bacterium]